MKNRDGAWRRKRLRDAHLYLCVNTRPRRGDLAALLDAALVSGVDLVQLRDKVASRHELAAAAKVFSSAANRHGALFIMNDDPELAVEVGADGVHVGQDDPEPADARDMVGSELLIGRSTHTPAQTDRALGEPIDYFTIGPVHATPTKEGRPGVGLEPVRHAVAVAGEMPWFVSGGMDAETAPAVLAAGARGLVVVRAITEADDPARAASGLAAMIS